MPIAAAADRYDCNAFRAAIRAQDWRTCATCRKSASSPAEKRGSTPALTGDDELVVLIQLCTGGKDGSVGCLSEGGASSAHLCVRLWQSGVDLVSADRNRADSRLSRRDAAGEKHLERRFETSIELLRRRPCSQF